MPIARVQLPDGRVARLEVPEGTTPEQVESFVFNGMKAPSKAAQDTAKFETKIRKEAAPSKLERFGRGFEDIRQGAVQGGLMIKDLFTGRDEAGDYTKAGTEELDMYERTRGPDAGIDLMRIGGNVAATLPAMLVPGGAAASLATRAAAGAGAGALTGASFFTPEGESKAAQIGVGALVGAAAPAVIEGVKRLGGSILDRVVSRATPKSLQGEITVKLQQEGIDWNKLTAEAQKRLLADAQTALDTGGTLDDAMLRNKAIIESIPGAQATKASVTRAPRDWQNEKNLRGIQGVGDEIVAREQSNARAMTDYLSELRAASGGKAATATEAGESAVNALKVADKSKQQAVDDLYAAFRDSGLKDAPVPEHRLMDALTKILDEIGHDNIPSSVQQRLKDFGFLGGERTRFLTVQQADQFNRLLNANNPGYGPASKAIGAIKGALNEALIETPGGGQLLTKAREAAAQRFAEADASKGISAALDDVSPDKFVQRFIRGADIKDLRATMAELKKTDLGRQAVKDIKGTIFDDLLLKATGSSSVDDVAFKAGSNGLRFSGSAFGKALDGIAPEKLHQIFTPDEIGALRTLQKASKLLTEDVAFSDVNHSKTTAALANLLLKVGNTPLLGRLVSPIIGTAKVGMDWVKDANARKQVAEALLASVVKAGEGKPLSYVRGERLVPGAAAAVAQEQ